MNLIQYKKLDRLISRENTGSTVKLSKSMGVSERSLKRMISMLKNECEAPVKFNRKKCTYYYSIKGNCQFGFLPSVKDELTSALTTAVTSVIMKILPVLSIVFPFCLDY